MQQKIRVGIVGGAGYTAGELIRILMNHPFVDIQFVHSKSHAGKQLDIVHEDLLGATELLFSSTLTSTIDLLFLCLGHGESVKFLQENEIEDRIRVIDLSQDFRLQSDAVIGNRSFVYGLPELNKDKIAAAQNIANPGCFATAIQLGILPFIQSGEMQDVYTTGITGSTGAGAGLTSTGHFSWRANNIQAYKSLTHQHLGEIHQSFRQQLKGNNVKVHFVPWRGDFTRGIFVSSQFKSDLSLDSLYQQMEAFYIDAPFVKISRKPIFLKQVVNTNFCFIHMEQQEEDVVVHTVIDNLLKGACGQAVQNMNLLFGLNEKEGLHLKANYF